MTRRETQRHAAVTRVPVIRPWTRRTANRTLRERQSRVFGRGAALVLAMCISILLIQGVSAGTHTFEMHYSTSTGTLTVQDRNFIIVELN